MSKLKKGLALTLAVIMAFSSMLTAFAEFQPLTSGYEPGSKTVNNPSGSFWVDTSETTEIIRVRSATNKFAYGNVICAATPSGMPEVVSTGYQYSAYAGETPSYPKVVLKVYGMSESDNIKAATITSNKFNSSWSDTPAVESGSDANGSYVKYIWTFAGDDVVVAEANKTDGTNSVPVTYTITYTINGRSYTQYAHACVKDILRPAGSDIYVYNKDKDVRSSNITYMLGANMTSGFELAQQGTKQRSYINFESTINDEGSALSGAGLNDAPAAATATNAFNIADTAYGSLTYYSTSEDYSAKDGCKTLNDYANAIDGNRAVATIYVDKGYDHLGKGTGTSQTGNTNANGLNMRLVLKAGEGASGFGAVAFNRVGVRNDKAQGFSCYNQNDTTQNNSIFGTTNYPDLAQLSVNANDEHGKRVVGSVRTASGIDGGDGSTENSVGLQAVVDAKNQLIASSVKAVGNPAYSEDSNKPAVWASFKGYGPTTETANWSVVYQTIFSSDSEMRNATGGCNEEWQVPRGRQTTAISLNFHTYDTTALRTTMNAIKQANPQKWQYYIPNGNAAWTNFITAYNAAGEIVANFVANQSAINTANTNLANAWSALQALKYTSNGSIYVRHLLVDDDGNVLGKMINDETITVDSNGQPIVSGATFTINCASAIAGYGVTGTSTLSGQVIYESNGTAHYFKSNGEEYSGDSLVTENGIKYLVFKYQSINQSLTIITNNNYNSGAGFYFTSQYKTGETPDFEALLNIIGGKENHYFDGFYENYDGDTGVFSNPVNTTTFTMPAGGVSLYMKWVPTPVRIKITPNVTAVAEQNISETTPTEGANGELSDITFSEPEPASVSGYEFLGYFSNPECTNPVSWPMTASYTDPDAYPIETGTDFNFVHIYSKYVNLTNKIAFDVQGGTLPSTNPNGLDIVDGEMSYADLANGTAVSFPVPTREGYEFKYWADASGNPISAWYDVVEGEAVAKNPSQLVKGTNLNTTGFIATAVWEAVDITITFRLNIQDSDNIFNSNDDPFYAQITVKADSKIDADNDGKPDTELWPSDPQQFGKNFNYWSYDGARFSYGGKYPMNDVTLIATWIDSSEKLFVDLSSYVVLSDVEHPTDTVSESDADFERSKPGDYATIKFTASGKFFASASSFIFAYDKSFFEKITDVDVFELNQDNSYISGIEAIKTENLNSSVLNTVYGGYITSNADYGVAASDVGLYQLSINPDVTKLSSYNTVSMDDTNYLVTIRLQIKPTATGTGTFWLPGELLRTGSQTYGDTFVANTEIESGFEKTETTNLALAGNAYTTINLDETARPQTTITVYLPKDTEGTVLGAFDDNTTAPVTYTGYAENIIYDFKTPVREGYTIKGYYGYDPIENTVDYSDELVGGFYGKTDQDGKSYLVEWEPIPYQIKLYMSDKTTVFGTLDVVYAMTYADMLADPTNAIYLAGLSIPGTEFVGWIPMDQPAAEENVVSGQNSTYVVTSDDEWYMFSLGEQKEVKFVPYYVEIDNTDPTAPEANNVTMANNLTLSKAMQAALGVALRVGDTVSIVEELPETPASGVKYILAADLEKLFKGTYLQEGETESSFNAALTDSNTSTNRSQYATKFSLATSQLPITFTVDNTASQNVRFEAQNSTVVYNADGGTYTGTLLTDNGDGTYSYTAPHYSRYDYANESKKFVKTGYVYSSITASKTHGVANRSLVIDNTYTIKWNPADVRVHYADENGNIITALDTATTGKYNAASVTLVNKSNANAPVKTGYTLTGWIPATYDAATSKCTATDAEASATLNILNNESLVYVTVNGDETTYDIYVVPSFEINKYTVTYKTSTDGAAPVEYNPGEGYGSAEYNSAYTVASNAPDVSGFTFDGWYYDTDTEKENKVTSINPITEDVTLIGYYNPVTYKVKFVSNDDDSTIAYSDVAFGKTITAPTETFNKAGHTLAGWTTTEGGTEAEVAAVGGTFPTLTVAEDNAIVYYAVWTPNQKNYNINVIYEGIPEQSIADITDTKPVTGSRVGDTVTATDKDEYKRAGFEYDETRSVLTGVIPAADGETLNLTVYYKRSSYVYSKTINGINTEIGTYLYGQTVATVEDPEVEGYKFNGWVPAKVTTMPAEDYEIVASMALESYTIDFNLKGGSGSIQPITADYGTAISLPTSSNVSYTGYDFGGWKYGDEVVNWTSMPDLGNTGESVVLDAVWTAHNYTVTFHYNDGVTADSSSNVAFGSAITQPTNPEKTGYAFSGWYTEPDFSSEKFQSWSSMPAQNLDLYAKFTINTYEVTFDAGEGEFTRQDGYSYNVMYNKATLTGDYNTDVVAPTAVAREGYYLTGWDNLPEKMPANNTTTATAQWAIEQYKVVFATNGGSAVESQTYTYGETVTLPASTKEGYNFGGWYFDNNTFDDFFGKGQKTIGDLGDSNADVTAEIVVYAKWTEDEFAVIFHGNNGKWDNETDKSKDVVFGTEIVAPENPDLPGYTFAGWFTAAVGGDELTPGTILTTLGAEYYAHWEANELTVKFNPNSGKWGDDTAEKIFPVFMDAEIAPVKPADPTRYGYTFNGWNTAADGTGDTLTADATLTNAEGETYYAQWTANIYDAKFYDVGEHLYDTVQAAFDSVISAPADPSRTGYDFDGWDGFTENVTTMNSEDGMSFIAKWIPRQYAAEFISEGVTIAKPMVNFDAEITYSGTTPTKFGHSFAGWSATVGGEPLEGLGKMDSIEGKTFYAVFTPDTITVTFHGNGGLWDDEETATADSVFGQTTVAPAELPVQEGYTPKGISTDPDADPATASFDLPTLTDPTIEYYYIWDLNSYDITFDANGGKWSDEATSKSVKYFHFDEVSAYTPAPEQYGYAFIGWSDSANGSVIDFANDAPIVTGETTFYAIYDYSAVKVIYKITKDGTTFETYDTYYVLFNDEISPLPYNEYGYELKDSKWYTDSDLTEEFTGTTVASTDTIIIYGAAEPAEFEVKYYSEGGQFVDGTEGTTKTATKTYGSEADDVAVTKTGYNFIGWTPDLGAVYGDTEYSAVWSAKVYDITFNFNGDTANETETISSAYDSEIDTPATDGRKEGYNFLGWYTDPELETALTWETIAAAAGTGTAVDAYASWSADQFVITFDPDNGTDPYTATKNFDDVILGDDEKNITKTGYCFMGWADESGEMITDASTVIGTQTYTAQWAPATVVIKYYFVEDGNTSVVELDTADYGESYTVLGYTNGQYTVSQWHTADEEVITAGSSFIVGQTGMITLTATAGVDTESGTKYLAEFDPNEGEFAAGTVYEFYLAEGEEIVAPAAPTRTGYTFLGWDEEPATMGDSDVKFTAIWEANTYTITYVYIDADSEEQSIDAISQKYGENYDIPAEPDVTNYVFVGWKFDGTTNTIDSASLEALTVEGDAKIFAVLTQDAFVVSFYSYGTAEGADPLNGTCNVLVDKKNIGAGDGLITVKAPNYDNFKFAGWFTSEGVEYKENDAVTSGNLDLYARYDRVVVKLVAKEGSTAMVERDGIVETYNTEYTVGTNAPFGVTSIVEPITDEYGEYSDNYEGFYVYGLNIRLTEEQLADYVEVQGNGHYEVTLSAAGTYGTGAVIKVIDDVTSETVEEFYIVIFGDLNGDSLITSTDTSVFSKESKDKVWSEGETKIGYKLKAADLSADGFFSSTDTSVVKSVVRQAKIVDQINGTAFDNVD